MCGCGSDTCNLIRATNELQRLCDLATSRLLHFGQHFAGPDCLWLAMVVLHYAARQLPLVKLSVGFPNPQVCSPNFMRTKRLRLNSKFDAVRWECFCCAG
jgi:hypothetical protein